MTESKSAIERVLNLSITDEMKLPEEEVLPFVEAATEGYQGYRAPEVGKPHPTIPNLISTGESGWGWFNTETLCYEKDVMRLTVDNLKDVFRMAAWINAHELVFQDDECIAIEVPGKTVNMTSRVLSRTEVMEIFSALVGTSVTAKVSNKEKVQFAFTIPWTNKEGLSKYLRFRGNGTPTIGAHGSSEGCIFTIRKLGDEAPTYESLKFDPFYDNHLFPSMGMVVFAGETSSGKTTSIAGIWRKIVSNPAGGIAATYESPPEFEYRSVKAPNFRIGQTDMTNSLNGSYIQACEDAMRRAASYLLIGEVLIEGAARGCVSFAQSGHAVYTTFHAASPMDFVNRWLGLFPINEYDTVRTALIGTLNIVVCVRLLNTISGGRVQIRGSLHLTEKMRSRLRATNSQNFISTIKDMYVEQGMTMRDDLRRYRDVISRKDYKQFMYEFEGGHNDAEEVYPDDEYENALETES